jgi:GrpB-like predicted nucleotidyltransferase (UPF0157 family)
MILLVRHDAAWACDFASEADRLTEVAGDLLLDLQHIGSTAVPELLAKPVIDMLATVQNVEDLDVRSETFEALGYQVMGEFGMPGRRYFRKDDSTGRRTHQLHAFAKGSGEIARHLDFRDYLRAHAAVAEAYAALKEKLAQECLGDMSRYTDGKTVFIRDVEQRAAIWKRDPSVAMEHQS